jgi:hypothetical protein
MTPGEHPELDSLDIIELQMALEEALSGEAGEERAERIGELRARLAQYDIPREFWDELGGGDDAGRGDDDGLMAILVRRLGPKGPLGKSGVALRPPVDGDSR